ncbi:TPA: hypothetical protein ACH3X1_008478 [Trebouxia sp. C0004]
MVMQPINEDAKQGGTEWAALPEPNGWTLAVATMTIDPHRQQRAIIQGLRPTCGHITPSRKSSWEHFGGRKDDQQGVKFLEADLCVWAHNKFTPLQAQAKLCHNNMYAATYRSTMEVRKEFMPGIVQNYNKSKQVTATGQPSKVSIFKGKLNPMHLSVHKDYLNDKGLAFDEQAWAVEHFLLNDPKVQQQLFKYLIPASQGS